MSFHQNSVPPISRVATDPVKLALKTALTECRMNILPRCSRKSPMVKRSPLTKPDEYNTIHQNIPTLHQKVGFEQDRI
jgi:hypothetical protein